MAWRGLTTPQWATMRGHLPQPKRSARGGRPRIADRRGFEGLLWMLWTGSPWSELPRRYGSLSTGGRRLKDWEEMGLLRKLWRAFLAQLNDQRQLRGDECVADGSFISTKKGDEGRHDETWQGHQVDGAGRWHGDLRWEHTWRRRPRRRSRSLHSPSRRSRLAGPASPAGPASGPTA